MGLIALLLVRKTRPSGQIKLSIKYPTTKHGMALTKHELELCESLLAL